MISLISIVDAKMDTCEILQKINTSNIKVQDRDFPPRGLPLLKNRQYNENIARSEVRDFPLGLRFKKHICFLHIGQKSRERFSKKINRTHPVYDVSYMEKEITICI